MGIQGSGSEARSVQSVGLVTLGNVIGGSSHFGQCPKCGSQHMSTHDRVQPNPKAPWQFFCERCAA